jgi:hypothetical protein
MMKAIIAQLIDEYHERKSPALVARQKKMPELIAQGIPIKCFTSTLKMIAYFSINDFQTIL